MTDNLGSRSVSEQPSGVSQATAVRNPFHSPRRRKLYATLVVVAVVVIVGSAAWYLIHAQMAGSSPTQPLPSSIAMGPITNDSTGTSAIYASAINYGNPAIRMENVSFEVRGSNGTILSLASVCVANASGTALGMWVNGFWSVRGNSTVCSVSATVPPPKNGSIAAGDELYFYLGPSVKGGVPVGSNFTALIWVNGTRVGSVTVVLGE